MTVRKRLIGAAAVYIILASVTGFAESGKVDPRLALMTEGAGGQAVAGRLGVLLSATGAAEPLVSLLVRFRGDLSGVASLGGKIRSVIGDVATVDLPVSALAQLSQLPNIVYLEATKRVRPSLDISVPSTGASAMRSGVPPGWAGYTGRSVIIGVIDTGIDLKHADFKDPSGKSRILYLWDQAAITGTHPSGYGYGNECTQTTINAGLCPETDTDGHGTHVAGIAAGNGSATGNGLPAYRYVGMAPEADLIVVNSLNSNVTQSSSILDAIAYIEAKAASLGKPSVINMSFGSDLGPHDGTSNYERALDNASGPGRILVGAAGNENGAGIHAGGTVSQGGSATLGFTIPAGDTIEGLDIWYAGADQMAITVSNVADGACTTPMVNPGEIYPPNSTTETACGFIGVASSPNGINPNNGDNEIFVLLANGNSHPLASGGWKVTLSGTSIANGRFDGWFEFSGDPNNTVQFTDLLDNSITLDDSGTATEPIAVGAYTTKKSWNSLTGVWQTSRTLEDIASFSSRGPRRACTDATACPTVQKPEIAAPGSVIMSSLSVNYTPPSRDLIDPDGVHFVEEGTSMAAPHMTGAVALLLQAAPTLTPDQIKSLLSTSATFDSFTQSVPNNTWGYGKLDVKTAYGEIANPLPAPPAGLSATVAGNQVTLSWIKNIDPDLFGYNVYRSVTPGSGYGKIASLPATAVKVTDMGVTVGKTYYYVVRATNSFGSESLDSKEVSATLPAPPSGGGGCVMFASADGDSILAGLAALSALCLAWRKIRSRVRRR